MIKPLAALLGRRHDCRIIEKQIVTSTRFEEKAVYAEFLHWLGTHEAKRRVRSWDWFISNAMRTLNFLVFLFFLLNLATAVILVVFSWVGASPVVVVTWRSWLLIAMTAVVFVLLIPGDIHHYRVRAEGDDLLYKEFLAAKTSERSEEPVPDP